MIENIGQLVAGGKLGNGDVGVFTSEGERRRERYDVILVAVEDERGLREIGLGWKVLRVAHEVEGKRDVAA